MNHSSEVMYARLKNFRADPEALRAHFLDRVQKLPSTPYRDNRVDYVGWAVTSRDGTLDDGIRRIAANGPNVRGVHRTDACSGTLAEVMDALNRTGLKPYRARIMQLESEGAEMPLHTDANRETWRLHVPILTNENSFFEWEREDGSLESVHLPADGSAWLVRVDVRHRAVNRSHEPANRVHLLMGLGLNPPIDKLSEPWLPVTLGQPPSSDAGPTAGPSDLAPSMDA